MLGTLLGGRAFVPGLLEGETGSVGNHEGPRQRRRWVMVKAKPFPLSYLRGNLAKSPCCNFYF